MRVIAVFVLLLAMAGTARAGFYSGDDVYEWCTTKSQYAVCYRYLEQVIETNQALMAGSATENRRLCIPDGVGVEQLRQIVVKNLTDIDDRQRPAAGLVWLALLEEWRCSQ
jgi:hypothetical protein